jgi:hypothetical protein
MHVFDSEVSVTWRKSARSVNDGACVELALMPSGKVAIRNSRDPLGPILLYTQSELYAFLDGAKKGEFDDLC